MARRKEGARAWVGISHRTKDLPRKDRRWEVAYEDPDDEFKRRRKGGFKTKDEAEDWRITFLGQAKAGTWHDPARGDRLFKEVAEEWFDSQVFAKANTERTHRRIIKGERSLLRTRFGNTRAGDIRHSDVREWVKSLTDQGKATSTVRNNFYSLRKVMQYAVTEGLLVRDPTVGVRLPRASRPNHAESERYPLTTKQINAICEALPEPWSTFTKLAAVTGLRPEELTGLQVRDFDEEAFAIRVERVWAGGRYEAPKTALSRRTVRLDTHTGLRVERYLKAHQRRAKRWFADPDRNASLAEHPADRLPLFVGVGEFRRGHRRVGTEFDWLDYSRPAKHGWFYGRYWKPVLEAVGLPDYVTFYDLRHAHASLLAERIGQPGALTLKECQERLGHSNMSTFYDRYVHTAVDDNNRHRNALDDLWAVDEQVVDRLRRSVLG